MKLLENDFKAAEFERSGKWRPAHLQGLRHAVVVPGLLGRQALVGGVAGVGKPRPLLKLGHAFVGVF